MNWFLLTMSYCLLANETGTQPAAPVNADQSIANKAVLLYLAEFSAEDQELLELANDEMQSTSAQVVDASAPATNPTPRGKPAVQPATSSEGELP